MLTIQQTKTAFKEVSNDLCKHQCWDILSSRFFNLLENLEIINDLNEQEKDKTLKGEIKQFIKKTKELLK